ncbi:MAG: pca operon transcription factor PcaQ [Pseudomonadota bacterium]
MEYIKARRIKMRHLSAFVETVKCGSLKAAAQRTHLTQPSISKTLKDLEEIIGAPLLNRDRGGIELTREGAVFRQFAEQSLAALSHGLTSLEALNAGEGALLRIGTLPSVAADLLPEAIVAFSELSPSTPVTVEDGPISALLERLRRGDLDLVVGRMGRPEIMSDFSFTQLYSEQVVFAAAADHPLINCTDLDQLNQSLVLFPPKGAAIRPLIERYLITHGIGKWQNRIETVSGAFGRSMTLGPVRAIWIISQGVVARDIAAGRMAVLPIDTADMAGPVGIMARSEEDPTPTIKLFRQALLAALT